MCDIAMPEAGPMQIRLRVKACGLCRTDLHVVDGDLREPKFPLVPGHQIVGVINQVGADVRGLAVGDRVGVPWLGGSCVDFLAVARTLSIVAETTVYRLEDANRALSDLRRGDAQGSVVLRMT
jgi:D-arabinose 1-dehydrogenase-like Zn-dependent alcohol dehydrogenase